ncbi:hypothetical protein [Microbacterium rhizosphaerae]|uniref:Uncharacterized protein n=1 Tax=Microbacterium rhizosphaerae TaxID=1678237 RepID=A0ABZ0SRF0_9MICO|nr:hypothetical protein [Microbacterium rhizosphaerae]WPR90861.1 hypothetical protein SM116_06080 [Microbacterium rhizosphaerae]
MAGFWGKRNREQDAADADLAARAQKGLVEADERMRLTSDELDFAIAELGDNATADLRAALDSVRVHMGEAFQLHQLNHDEIPDTPEELRTRNARIVQLCEWAEALLDEKTAALAQPIALARNAPQILANVRTDAVVLRERIEPARETLARLSERYSPDALRQVAQTPEETARLLDFAVHGADIAERRRASGQREQGNMALEAAIESMRRAAAMLDALETYEVEALRAESTLAAVIDDSRSDLVRARTAPQSPAVVEAARALSAALAALPASGEKSDPLAELTQLREANTALDAAVAAALERAANPLPTVAQVEHALDDADRQLSVARDVIAGQRGWIGADARTRLAEAERLRAELPGARSLAEDDRPAAVDGARRVAYLASEALQYAQRDIDDARPYGGWGQPGAYPQQGWGGRPRSGMGDVMGGVLGGLVIGGLIDDIFN